MRNHRNIASLAVAAAMLGIAVPSASAVYGDDFVAAPSSSGSSAVTQDLRSPDTRDAATLSSSSQPSSAVTRQDLRSPDARDAANGVTAAATPDVEVIRLPESGSGFDWGDAGIGAGGLALLLTGLAGIALAMRRTGHGISLAR